MKKTAIILIFVMAAAILAGCQATPDKPVVVQKDMEQMLDKAQQTASPGNAGNLKEQLKVPGTLKEELTSAKGKLKIHADAKIYVPDAAALPTVQVGMATFTEEDVKRLYKTLFGEAMPIDPEHTEDTKAWGMRIVQGLLDQKKAGNLDKYGSMEELDAAIKEATQEAAEKPAHFTRAEPDFTFKTNEGMQGSEVHLRAAPDDATISDLLIYNAQEGMGQSRVEYYRDLFESSPLSCIKVGASSAFNQTTSKYFVPPKMGEDAARKLARDTIDALGLKDFVCSGCRINALYLPGVDAEDAPRRGIYEYMFTRQIGGVPVTYTNDDGNQIDFVGKSEKAFYGAPWLYEKVRIIIDDKGILYLLWNSPYTVGDTVTNATSMMPYSEIKSIFDKMIPVAKNIYDTSEQGLTCDMYITGVQLGLMRITQKDIGTSGLIIPVWDFMGYTQDSEGNIDGRDGYRSLLTVNAIDGSIID